MVVSVSIEEKPPGGHEWKNRQGHQAVFSVFPLKGTSAVVLATAAIGSVGGPCEGSLLMLDLFYEKKCRNAKQKKQPDLPRSE
jgi:hypothetical protein